jgi:hypothetical protein
MMTMMNIPSQLRRLDVDDIWILHRLNSETTLQIIADELKITPPALSHRVKKHKEVFGDIFIPKSRKLNEYGLQVSKKCEQMLTLLLTTKADD